MVDETAKTCRFSTAEASCCNHTQTETVAIPLMQVEPKRNIMIAKNSWVATHIDAIQLVLAIFQQLTALILYMLQICSLVHQS